MNKYRQQAIAKLRAHFPNRFPVSAVRTPLPTLERANIVLGIADKKPVPFSFAVRNGHTLIIGATGSGKSVLFTHVALQALRLGENLILIDPHGDVYKQVLEYFRYVPRPVHVIDFNSPRVPGFNPLACPEGCDPSVIVGNNMAALEIVWEGETFAQKPTIERNLRALLTALVELKLTYNELPYLIDHKDEKGLRNYATQRVQDVGALDELRRLNDLASKPRRERDFEQEVVGTRNRIARLLASEKLRATFGRNGLDFLRLLDSNEPLLVNLAGGMNVADSGADLFGRLMVRSLLFAAERRRTNTPVNVMLDEAPRLFSKDIPKGFAEVRKHGICIWAGMQWLSQAEDPFIRDALLNGPNNRILFRANNAEDAEDLARTSIPFNLERPVAALIRPTVTGHEIIRLKNEGESKQSSTTDSASVADQVSGGTDISTGRAVLRGASVSYDEAETEISTESAGQSHRVVDGDAAEDPSRITSATTTGRHTSARSGGSENFAITDTKTTTERSGWSHTDTKGKAESHGTGSNKGSSEALKPILEERPSTVHSVANEQYAAGQLLVRLPTGKAWVSYVTEKGRQCGLLTVPNITPKDVSDYPTLRDNIMEQNDAPTLDDALQSIVEREEAFAPAEYKKKRVHKSELPSGKGTWGKV